MKTFFIISLALCFLCFSMTVTEAADADGEGKCITTEHCLKGIPEDEQPPYPGTCCEPYFETQQEGTCVPKGKAKKCNP